MSVEDFASDHASFASRYAGMSDGELLNLASRSWELSDAAWDALEDELDRRHLELPRTEDPPEMQALQKRDLVLLRVFSNLPEALLAKSKLESAGVACFLADDNMVRLYCWTVVGGVKLMVEADEFTEASRLLNEPAPQGFEDD